MSTTTSSAAWRRASSGSTTPAAAADRALLTRLAVALQQDRIRMRNAPFSRPLPAARIDELCDGRGDAVAFDFDRALGEPG